MFFLLSNSSVRGRERWMKKMSFSSDTFRNINAQISEQRRPRNSPDWSSSEVSTDRTRSLAPKISPKGVVSAPSSIQLFRCFSDLLLWIEHSLFVDRYDGEGRSQLYAFFNAHFQCLLSSHLLTGSSSVSTEKFALFGGDAGSYEELLC